MKINRLHFSFTILFFLFTVILVLAFRKSSEEKINVYLSLKESNLPIIVINTDYQKPIKSREDYKRSNAYFFDNFSELILSDALSTTSSVKHRARIRGRGNSTWKTFDTNKRSYLLKLDKEYEVFGLPAARKWILQGNVTDKSSLRNAYSYYIGKTIFNHCGWAPKTKFVNLIFNNKFIGLYLLMEKAEIAPNRINLPLDPKDESFLAEVNSRLNREWNFRSDKGVCLSIREKEGADQSYYLNAEKILKDFEKVLFNSDLQDAENGYHSYIDFDSFVDWYIVNEFTKNHDAYFQDSCFMYYSTADKKIHMGPIWDFDISCGNNKDECSIPEGLFIQGRHWFKKLWEDPYFRLKVAERWLECRPLLEESFYWIEREATILNKDAELDDKIWQRFGYRQWPNAPGYKERKTYRAEVDYMKNWLAKRAAWLDKEWKPYIDLYKDYKEK